MRVFPDPKTGLYQMEWRENGRRLTRSLRHRDWMRAKREADEFAADFVGPDLNGKADTEPEPLTLGTLFDIYGDEVTPTKAERVQRRDRVATGMFLDFLGRDRRPETLSQRDWDRFIRERRADTVGAGATPGLAFAEAEVRQRPDGPAPQGALRARSGGRRPRPCCAGTSSPTRLNSGRQSGAAAGRRAEIQSAGTEQRQLVRRIP